MRSAALDPGTLAATALSSPAPSRTIPLGAAGPPVIGKEFHLHWLSPGDNSWQMTAATLVGLMSVPGLVVLYGGVMQKRWSVNSMMMAFIAFALVLVVWVGYGFKMGFGAPIHASVDAVLERLAKKAASHA